MLYCDKRIMSVVDLSLTEMINHMRNFIFCTVGQKSWIQFQSRTDRDLFQAENKNTKEIKNTFLPLNIFPCDC